MTTKRKFGIPGVLLGAVAYIGISYVCNMLDLEPWAFLVALASLGTLVGWYAYQRGGLVTTALGVSATSAATFLHLYWDFFGTLSLFMLLIPSTVAFLLVVIPGSFSMLMAEAAANAAAHSGDRRVAPPPPHD